VEPSDYSAIITSCLRVMKGLIFALYICLRLREEHSMNITYTKARSRRVKLEQENEGNLTKMSFMICVFHVLVPIVRVIKRICLRWTVPSTLEGDRNAYRSCLNPIYVGANFLIHRFKCFIYHLHTMFTPNRPLSVCSLESFVVICSLAFGEHCFSNPVGTQTLHCSIINVLFQR
jgi:hypothetical protein